jgi:hypothetical protein
MTHDTATHKRGDTFDASGQLTVTDGGAPLPSLQGWTGRCQLRTATGQLIADLNFSWVDAAQRLCRLYAGSTQAWPLGLAELDIELTSSAGHVVSTQTTRIKIARGVTE